MSRVPAAPALPGLAHRAPGWRAPGWRASGWRAPGWRASGSRAPEWLALGWRAPEWLALGWRASAGATLAVPRAAGHRRRAWALGLGLGFAADRVFGDPARWHPVAGFGQLAQSVERRTYRDSRPAGVAHVLGLVAGVASVGVALERLSSDRPLLRGTLVAGATWAVLGGRTLEREAMAVHDLLAAGDLDGARERIRSLVGRDTSELDEAGLARAVIESVAENTSDAVVAPLLWGAVAGLPGLFGYRALNTLDAMIGHHNDRYERFGWAAARLDDVANWVPARVAALLAAGLAPLVAGRPVEALRVVRRDAAQHPSPNAGQVEAAFAGALGVRLGGTNVYGGREETRGELGDGAVAGVLDMPRAIWLALGVGVGAAAVAVAVAASSPVDRLSGRAPFVGW